MEKNNVSIGRILLILLFAFIIILSLGAIGALGGITMVRRWIPFVIALVIALVSGLTLHRLWPRFTHIDKPVVNYAIHVVFSTILLWGAFYTVNALFARGATYTEEITVERRFTETHYRSRRTGRNSYSRGAPYKTYHIEARFPDGRTRNLQITGGRYRDLRSGDTIALPLRKGFFGVPVANMNFDVPPRRHCRTVGPRSDRHPLRSRRLPHKQPPGFEEE